MNLKRIPTVKESTNHERIIAASDFYLSYYVYVLKTNFFSVWLYSSYIYLKVVTSCFGVSIRGFHFIFLSFLVDDIVEFVSIDRALPNDCAGGQWYDGTLLHSASSSFCNFVCFPFSSLYYFYYLSYWPCTSDSELAQIFSHDVQFVVGVTCCARCSEFQCILNNIIGFFFKLLRWWWSILVSRLFNQ